MKDRLVIIGAGGHGRVVAESAVKIGYKDIAFLDDQVVDKCMGFEVIGKVEDVESFDDGKTDFVIGIGNNEDRMSIAEKYKVNWATVVHPAAYIASHVSLGLGTVVMAGAVVNTGSIVGNHCIINTNSVIEHDNIISDYAHISPVVALGGAVHIGKHTHIGIGASVINNIKICSDCVIGAGAVVIEDITESGTYVGIPVRGKL